MTNEVDLETIEKYEDLIVLLRKLHADTPILEKQHKSIKQAFVIAQEKLETTIETSNDEIGEIKKKILTDFEKECRAIVTETITHVQEQATALIEKIQVEEKTLSSLLQKAEITSQQLSAQIGTLPDRSNKYSDEELIDGEIYTGEELIGKFASYIDENLFVKRIVGKTGKPWNNDYCMLVTDFSDTMIYGEIYKDGELSNESKGYSIYDSYMIYRGPSEKAILKSR